MPFLCIFIILFVATKYNHVENIEFDLLEYIYVALRLAKWFGSNPNIKKRE